MSILLEAMPFRGLKFHDINQDGHLDCLRLNGSLHVHYGDGSGSFNHHRSYGASSGSDINLVDIDFDGDLDIITAERSLTININLTGSGSMGTPTPEITLEEPVGTGLTDGVSLASFGSVAHHMPAPDSATGPSNHSRTSWISAIGDSVPA